MVLWPKLLASNVNGKMLSVIKNIFESAKSAVRLGSRLGRETYFEHYDIVHQRKPIYIVNKLPNMHIITSKLFSVVHGDKCKISGNL